MSQENFPESGLVHQSDGKRETIFIFMAIEFINFQYTRMHKFIAVLLKHSVKFSATTNSSWKISSISTSVMVSLPMLLSGKRGFTVRQNLFLSVMFFGFNLQ